MKNPLEWGKLSACMVKDPWLLHQSHIAGYKIHERTYIDSYFQNIVAKNL